MSQNLSQSKGAVLKVRSAVESAQTNPLISILREQHLAIISDYKDLLRRCLPYVGDQCDVSFDPDGHWDPNEAASLWSDIQHILRVK